ncbi:MAG: hypothetical protein ACLP01_09685 [Solirubrobacteraceae bacterium]
MTVLDISKLSVHFSVPNIVDHEQRLDLRRVISAAIRVVARAWRTSARGGLTATEFHLARRLLACGWTEGGDTDSGSCSCWTKAGHALYIAGRESGPGLTLGEAAEEQIRAEKLQTAGWAFTNGFWRHKHLPPGFASKDFSFGYAYEAAECEHFLAIARREPERARIEPPTAGSTERGT